MITKVIRAIGPLHTLMIIGTVIAVITLAIPANARTADHCLDLYLVDHEMEVTENVRFTGKSLTKNDWTVPHDTIVIVFDNEAKMVWNPRTVASHRKTALMDWIWTALHHEEESGFAPFAARDEHGRVWLISQYYSGTDQFACGGHPLDPNDNLTKKGGAEAPPFPTPTRSVLGYFVATDRWYLTPVRPTM